MAKSLGQSVEAEAVTPKLQSATMKERVSPSARLTELDARYGGPLAGFDSVDSAWRTLRRFAIYRAIIVGLMIAAYWGFPAYPMIGMVAPKLASNALMLYALLAVGLIVLTQLRTPSAAVQLTLQVFVDVTMVVLIMHASGGARSGWGVLLLVTLAAAALVSRGRMAFFHAAVASIAVLVEQGYQILYNDGSVNDFVPPGMLAGSYFVIAALGYTLAQYARGAVQIAERRGIDLANMAQINALVIRDMQDGFVIVDEHGVIRQHNQQSEALVAGLKGAEGRPLKEAAPLLAMLVDEWRQDRTRIYSLVRDPITQREYQMRCVVIGADQRANAMSPTVVFLEDASRIRSQAQHMKLVALGRLTASIAHEIRNPLSSINHAAELLHEDTDRSDADKRLLTIIQDNAHRLDRLVEEVLYLNRRDRAHPETIDLPKMLTRFVRDFCANEKIAESKIRVSIELAQTRDATIAATFDRSHLDQVLWNLVRNAVRHGSGGDGAVQIVVRSVRGRDALGAVELEVRDDGTGVPAEAQAHLFEPFFTTEAKGTGLGLYIARELAEVNGAQLEYVHNVAVKSKNADEPNVSMLFGACFRLTMKLGGGDFA